MNPHAGKVKLLPELIEITREARERAAAEAFDLAKVRTAIIVAGKGGFTSCLVGPKQCQNLRDTIAAKAAVTWLQSEGFSHAWEQRPSTEVRSGAEAAYDLLVTWRA